MLQIALRHGLGVLASTFFCVGIAKAAPTASMTLVAELYRAYAWQAISTSDAPFGKPLSQEKETVLRRYFTSELTSLLLADQHCVASTREVCSLGFDPMFASQDPAASDLAIRPAGSQTVMVEFTYPSSGERVILEYRMVRQDDQWRIGDIQYHHRQKASLKQMLSHKPARGQP
jgi:hypothetical protein